jgi:hypothetical protein
MSLSWRHFHAVSVPTSSYRSRSFFASGIGLESGKGGLETLRGIVFRAGGFLALFGAYLLLDDFLSPNRKRL